MVFFPDGDNAQEPGPDAGGPAAQEQVLLQPLPLLAGIQAGPDLRGVPRVNSQKRKDAFDFGKAECAARLLPKR